MTKWGVCALLVSKAILRARTYNLRTYSVDDNGDRKKTENRNLDKKGLLHLIQHALDTVDLFYPRALSRLIPHAGPMGVSRPDGGLPGVGFLLVSFIKLSSSPD